MLTAFIRVYNEKGQEGLKKKKLLFGEEEAMSKF